MSLIIATDVSEAIEELRGLDKVDTNVLIEYLKNQVPGIINFLIQIVFIIIFYIIGVKLIKFIRKIVRKSLDKANTDEGVKQFMDSFVKFALYFILILLIGSGFGLTAASVTALLGSAGLTIGLAMQGSLSNFAGGVLILILKPFKVGDYITIDGSNEEGTVYEIQLFYTKLKTPDNKVIIIPNGTLTDNSLVNYSCQDHRMINIKISISYSEDIKRVKNVIYDCIDLQDKIENLEDKEPVVYVDELAESSVIIGIRIWVKTNDYLEMKWKMTEVIKEVLDKNGITIQFNQLDVNVKSSMQV